MPKQVIGRAVAPPEGWKFSADGELIPDGVPSAEAFDRVYGWAKEKKYGLTPNGQSTVFTGRLNSSWRLKVHTDSWDTTVKYFGDGVWSPTAKSGDVSIGKVEYTDYRGVSYWNSCANCGRTGLASFRISGTRYCSFCVITCATDSCGARIPTYQGLTKCDKCEPNTRCAFCGNRRPLSECEELSDNDSHACKACADSYRCNECHKVTADTTVRSLDTRLCGECYGVVVEAERVPHEKFDEKELPTGGSLTLAKLPNRPVRIISIETEVDGDPQALANTLYNEGIVREGYVESYGQACPDQSSWPAFLKYDGSVTGGELINYLLQLDDPTHAESLRNVLSKLRSLEKLDKVAYNANCGGHIHIDAHNFSSDNVWRLLTGYNYLEDVIFRLAGAGHEYGHRTLVAGHDRANAGRGYSHPTAKGPWGVKSGAYRAAASQDRMTGLNFQPYLRAVQYCACGAGVESLRSCKCTLPKCTIEWRVWNSQGNPRILHGWLAFMQSLHAWADSPREMTDEQERELAPFAWTKKPWKETSQGHKNIAIERVKWIFENLVFSDTEKDSLAYSFQQTDIEFPATFWGEVRDLPPSKNRVVKAPRNCSVRSTPLLVCKPDRKVYGNPQNDRGYVGRRRPGNPFANAVAAPAPQRGARNRLRFR